MQLRKYTHDQNQTTASPIAPQQYQPPTAIFNRTKQTIQSFKQSVSQMQPFVLLGICIGVVIVITLIVVFFWRKYHHRQLYQESPQNFSSKPNLTLPQLLRYQQQIPTLTRPAEHTIARKQTYDGKFIQVTFKSHHNCIYFPNQLKKDCYFQVQIVKLSSVIQIGFVHKQDLKQICKQLSGQYVMNLDQYGVSVRTDGSTYVYGNNQINFQWRVQYGDTLGIGLTQHQGGSRRVWITKNGVMQNPPSEEERLKYIDISKEKGKTTVSKRKKTEDSSEDDSKKDKQQTQAAKKRIQLKTSRKFNYYAVIISESATVPKGETILNWNIGGQNFRLYDAQKLAGLLK